MVIPKWQQESTRPKRRNSPVLVIIFLLVTAICIKVGFYTSQFGAPKVGPPLPAAYSHLHDHDHPDPTYNTNNNNNDNVDDDSSSDTDPEPSKTDPVLSHITPAVIPTHTVVRPHRAPVNEWYKYRTEPFTSPNITITRNGTTSPGQLYCAPRSLVHRMSAPMILEDDGTLIWRGQTGESSNTKVQMLNGKPVLTYWRDERNFIIGHEYGEVHILDNTYTELYSICPKDMHIISNDNHKYRCNLDMHVLTLTDRGTLISTAYNISTMDMTAFNGTESDYIFDSQFYEIDIETEEILFSWKSLDHLDQLPLNASKLPFNRRRGSASHMSTPYDYFHINAVEPLDDGFLVNSRNMWNVFKVDKNGDIEWILNGEDGGDFELGPDTFFSWQHDARVINRTDDGLYVSLFNNDYSFAQSAVNVSDALTLYLDLDKMYAETTRTLKDTEERLFSLAMGNAQQLPGGHVFVNYGFGGTFKEFNEEDKVVMTGHFGRGSNRSFFSTYNMYRISGWHGKPTWPPKVYAEYTKEDNKTTVWMSWNGATDYDSWVIYAGLETLTLKKMSDKIKRAGFETSTTLTGNYTWFQAEAWSGQTALRNSTPIETHIYYDPEEYIEGDNDNSTDKYKPQATYDDLALLPNPAPVNNDKVSSKPANSTASATAKR